MLLCTNPVRPPARKAAKREGAASVRRNRRTAQSVLSEQQSVFSLPLPYLENLPLRSPECSLTCRDERFGGCDGGNGFSVGAKQRISGLCSNKAGVFLHYDIKGQTVFINYSAAVLLIFCKHHFLNDISLNLSQI